MFGVSNYTAAFKFYYSDERSNPIATKGHCKGVTSRGIGGVVRGAGKSDNRMGSGAIFPCGIPVTTLGKIRVDEVSGG